MRSARTPYSRYSAIFDPRRSSSWVVATRARLFPGIEGQVQRFDEHLLDLLTGESIRGFGQLPKIEDCRFSVELSDLDLPDRLTFLPVRHVDEEQFVPALLTEQLGWELAHIICRGAEGTAERSDIEGGI